MERNKSIIIYLMNLYVKENSNNLFENFVNLYDLDDEDLIRLRGEFNSILIKNLDVYKETPVIGFKRNN